MDTVYEDRKQLFNGGDLMTVSIAGCAKGQMDSLLKKTRRYMAEWLWRNQGESAAELG